MGGCGWRGRNRNGWPFASAWSSASQAHHDAWRLVGELPAPLARDAERAKLGRHPADVDPEREPPARELL
jgi:hypothetical protein